ncbi:hypothetical protein G9A89_012936 [Geosiphon pyriformis]|nr:hypothetical protein G9A89_012936 [Geosiphon pyriformis]
MSPKPKKNKQDLQNPKQIPNMSVISNNLTIPAKSTKKKPEIKTGTKPLHGIMPLFFITTQCLARTSQTSSQNAKQNLCTKTTIFRATILESLKTATDS